MGTDTLALEWMRRLREMVAEDIERYLRRIDPALLSGSLSPGALPSGTLVNRGTYSSSATYRPGDIVQAGDTSYIATARATGEAVTNPSFFTPVSARAVALADLTDVQLTSPANGDILVYDSSLAKWVNRPPIFYQTLTIGGENLTVGGELLILGV